MSNKKQRFSAPSDSAVLAEPETITPPDPPAVAIEDELEALEKQVADQDAARAVRLEARGKAAKVKQLRASLVEGPALEKAESEHGADKVRLVQTPIGGVIVKFPKKAAYKYFADKERIRTEDFEKLVRPCVLYPTVETYDQGLADYPGMLTKLANAVVQLAGVDLEKVAGK